MPKSIANRLYEASGRAKQMWKDANNGMSGSLQFAWIAFAMLDNKRRRDLVKVSTSMLLKAFQEKNREVAALGTGLANTAVTQFRETEWREVGRVMFKAGQIDILDNSLRQNVALALLHLPSRLGRLNCELAHDLVLKVFPDLSQTE